MSEPQGLAYRRMTPSRFCVRSPVTYHLGGSRVASTHPWQVPEVVGP